jgi:hypothetical protein
MKNRTAIFVAMLLVLAIGAQADNHYSLLTQCLRAAPECGRTFACWKCAYDQYITSITPGGVGITALCCPSNGGAVVIGVVG